MIDVDDFLAHYGVKGMKWGTRRNKARTVYTRSPKSLSDAEIRRRIGRLEMEKKYNDLNSRDLSAGQKFTNQILSNVGSSVITATLTGAGLFAVKKIVEKKLGEDAAKMIPKRKK